MTDHWVEEARRRTDQQAEEGPQQSTSLRVGAIDDREEVEADHLAARALTALRAQPTSPVSAPAGGGRIRRAIPDGRTSVQPGSSTNRPERIARSTAAPIVIRRLWSSKELYAEGGSPSLKAKVQRGRSTYQQIGDNLDAYARAPTMQERLTKLDDLERLTENWLGDNDHRSDVQQGKDDDTKRNRALKLLHNAVKSARQDIFVDVLAANPATGYTPAMKVHLKLIMSDMGFRARQGDCDAITNGQTGAATKQLIVHAFTGPRRADANFRPVRDMLAGLENLTRPLATDVPRVFPAHAVPQVAAFYAARWLVRPRPMNVIYLGGQDDTAAFYLMSHMREAVEMGGEFATPAFQRALGTCHPGYIADIGETATLLTRRAARARVDDSVRQRAAAARRAFDQGDYVTSARLQHEARDAVEAALGAGMSTQHDDAANPPRVLGGALNQVIETTFPDGGGGATFTGFFKPEEREISSKASAKAGMDNADIRQGNRSVATYRIDQLIHTGVIPRTEWASRNGVFGTVMAIVDENYAGQPARVGDMALHTGPKEARVAKPDEKVMMRHEAQWLDPTFQRGMSNLQVLDAITGQLDRHPGNIFVLEDSANGRVLGVVGIDNDLAFGKAHTNPKQAFYNAQGAHAVGGLVAPVGGDAKVSHNTGIPRFIDAAVATNIARLVYGDVAATLYDLLTDAEIAATWSRIQAVQRYIAKHPERLINDPQTWGTDTAVSELSRDTPDARSYFAREALYRRESNRLDVVRLDPGRLAPIYAPGQAAAAGGGPPAQAGGQVDPGQVPQVLDQAEVERTEVTDAELDQLLAEMLDFTGP